MFIGYSQQGQLKMADLTAMKFRQDLKENEGARYEIKRITPESRKQRKFFEGAVVPLFCYLSENCNYKDNNDLKSLRETLKAEFNGKAIKAGEKWLKIGESTKGKLNEVSERVIDYMEENFGIDRSQVLNSKEYEKFRDEVYMDGQFNDFIEYLRFLGKLK